MNSNISMFIAIGSIALVWILGIMLAVYNLKVIKQINQEKRKRRLKESNNERR